MKPSVDVLIPALNEEKTIEKIIKDCLKIKEFSIRVFVVVDGKTTDKTQEEAKKAGALAIRTKGNGKGAAVKYAIPYLKSKYVVQVDADYQFLPIEIPKMITPLLSNYDITLGTRYEKESKIEEKSVNWLRRIGSIFLSLVTSIFAKQRITDVMAGFKAIKLSALKDLNLKTNHFGYEAELVIKSAKKGYKILNIPITYRSRVFGKSTVNSFKHGFLVLVTIIKTGLNK